MKLWTQEFQYQASMWWGAVLAGVALVTLIILFIHQSAFSAVLAAILAFSIGLARLVSQNRASSSGTGNTSVHQENKAGETDFGAGSE